MHKWLCLGLLTPSLAAFAEELDLVRCMEMAVAHSSTVKASASANREALLRESQAWGALGPKLDLESTQAWLSSDVNKLVGKSAGDQKIPDRVNTVGLTLTQPLVALAPLLLKVKSEVIASKQEQLEENQTARTVRLMGAETFLRAFKASELLSISKVSLKLAEKQRQDGESLAKMGKLKPLDLIRLDLAIADAKLQISQSETVRDVALFALAETTGISEYKSISLLNKDKLYFQSRAQRGDSAETLLAESVRSRTDLAAARARMEMAALGREAARWELAPTISAFAKYERDLEKTESRFPTTLLQVNPRTGAHSHLPGPAFATKDIRDNFTLGLNFRWTLWDWNVRWNRGEELEAKAEGLAHLANQAERGVRLEVMQAWLELKSVEETVASAQTTVKFAQEVYRQQNALFQVGMGTATDLIAAERDQTRATAGLATAETDLELASVKILKALGKEPL